MHTVFAGVDALLASGKTFSKPVLTIGNFDGVHLGHQELISKTLEVARAATAPALAMTFRPHPRSVLKAGEEPALLLTYDEKNQHLKRLGLDAVIEEPFGREFSNLTAERFFYDYLLKRLSIQALVVGYDFGFGKEREGSQKVLQELCNQHGVKLVMVPAFQKNGATISSSKIRQFLANGELEQARDFLGYSFYYKNTVIRGEQRGRKIGFPTANQQVIEKVVLPYGVYATRTLLKDRVYPSVTNLGVRPTFNSPEADVEALVETHLIGETIDLYGSVIEVQFIKKIRSEQKFSGIDALKAQIQADLKVALSLQQ